MLPRLLGWAPLWLPVAGLGLAVGFARAAPLVAGLVLGSLAALGLHIRARRVRAAARARLVALGAVPVEGAGPHGALRLAEAGAGGLRLQLRLPGTRCHLRVEAAPGLPLAGVRLVAQGLGPRRSGASGAVGVPGRAPAVGAQGFQTGVPRFDEQVEVSASEELGLALLDAPTRQLLLRCAAAGPLMLFDGVLEAELFSADQVDPLIGLMQRCTVPQVELAPRLLAQATEEPGRMRRHRLAAALRALPDGFPRALLDDPRPAVAIGAAGLRGDEARLLRWRDEAGLDPALARGLARFVDALPGPFARRWGRGAVLRGDAAMAAAALRLEQAPGWTMAELSALRARLSAEGTGPGVLLDEALLAHLERRLPELLGDAAERAGAQRLLRALQAGPVGAEAADVLQLLAGPRAAGVLSVAAQEGGGLSRSEDPP